MPLSKRYARDNVQSSLITNSSMEGTIMLPSDRFIVLGGTGNHSFDANILDITNHATGLELEFGHIRHQRWHDGERGLCIENHDSIRGKHVIIFSCPITEVLELQLKDMVVGSKHQYGARSVTVVLSFFPYRRQDRPEKNHEITRLRWFIRDLKHWGADTLIVCEPHSLENTAAYCQEFGLTLAVSDPTPLFAEKALPLVQAIRHENVRVYSPDAGSIIRSLLFARALRVSVVASLKKRVGYKIDTVTDQPLDLTALINEYGVPITMDLNDVRDAAVFMREDELSTGDTAATTAWMLRRQYGARSLHFAGTHPVCTPGWKSRVPYAEPPPFESIWLGNTRPRGVNESTYEGSTGGKIETVEIEPVIAETLIDVIKKISD